MKIEIDFPDDKICGLLCCAREGGSNYWIRRIMVTYPESDIPKVYINESEDATKRDDPDAIEWGPLYVAPLCEGGSWEVTIDEDDAKPIRLDRDAILRGLTVMREKHPQHFGDALSGNEDADTGDCFLQCALLGKMVYS